MWVRRKAIPPKGDHLPLLESIGFEGFNSLLSLEYINSMPSYGMNLECGNYTVNPGPSIGDTWYKIGSKDEVVIANFNYNRKVIISSF